MLRPEHITARQLQNQRDSTRRTIAVGFVGALHVAVIYALASGLAANMAAHLIQDTQVAVIKEKPPDTAKPPPPPPPDFKIPPPDFVPPPEINIESRSDVERDHAGAEQSTRAAAARSARADHRAAHGRQAA